MPASVWGLGGVTELGESGLHGILVLRGQLSRDEAKGMDQVTMGRRGLKVALRGHVGDGSGERWALVDHHSNGGMKKRRAVKWRVLPGKATPERTTPSWCL